MHDKLWAGRFSASQAKSLDAYNSSIQFDQRMFREDIRGSIAHSRMLASVGLLTGEDQSKIEAELLAISDEIESGKLLIDHGAEDIHMFIESELTTRIGDAGKRLHTARSRNDQVACDLKLYLLREADEIKAGIAELIRTTLAICSEQLSSILPGYTHLQRAQPITLAHHLMAYVHMLLRDLDRLSDWSKRSSMSPLGAGALATTTYPINRQMTADLLGFRGIATNSLDAVSDRDFVIELAGVLALFMVHLSRWSEEIILWSTKEFGFITLSDAYSTGSSIMPQKKNPDAAELTRGKSGRSIGNLNTLLIMMKGLPLAYNKDMQEDKEAIFDSIDTVKLCLPAFQGMLATIKWNKDVMRAACSSGFLAATDLADYLVGKGLPFRDAHHVAGRMVKLCSEKGISLEEASLTDYQSQHASITDDVYLALDLDEIVNRRNIIGGPAVSAVQEDIKLTHQTLDNLLD